jgi:hypothetical protein
VRVQTADPETDCLGRIVPASIYSGLQYLLEDLSIKTRSVDLSMLWTYLGSGSSGESDDPAVRIEWSRYWGDQLEKTPAKAFGVARDYLASQVGWSQEAVVVDLVREASQMDLSNPGDERLWIAWLDALAKTRSNPGVQSKPQRLRRNFARAVAGPAGTPPIVAPRLA